MPLYEGDPVWRKRSNHMGKRVVPGTSRSLYPCDVTAALAALEGESVFHAKGTKPLRARKGSPELVIGYKFNSETAVAFRGVDRKFSTSVRIGPTVKAAMDGLDTKTTEVLNKEFSMLDRAWWAPTSALTLDYMVAYMGGKGRVSLRGSDPTLFRRGIVACFRRIAVQALMLQNVPIEEYTSVTEAFAMDMDSMLDDLSDLDFDF